LVQINITTNLHVITFIFVYISSSWFFCFLTFLICYNHFCLDISYFFISVLCMMFEYILLYLCWEYTDLITGLCNSSCGWPWAFYGSSTVVWTALSTISLFMRESSAHVQLTRKENFLNISQENAWLDASE
jgi:hypothetical protein